MAFKSVKARPHRTRRHLLGGLGASIGAGVIAGCGAPFLPTSLDPPLAPALRVASFNIRYLDLTRRGQFGGRSLEDWQSRRHVVLTVLRAVNADILAFQEMESWDGIPQNGAPVQRVWLTRQMQDYGNISGTSTDGRESSQPIFFRRDRFTALDGGTQPLDAPDSGSNGQVHGRDRAFAGYSDLVTWARLRDRITGEALTVVNLHLHFRSQRRQRRGAQIALQMSRAAMARGDRVVVLGDMNVLARTRPMEMLRAGDLTRVPSEGASFHFNRGLHAFGAIDHILHGPRMAALGATQIARWQVRDTWPSDHYPIWADLQPM